MQDGTFEDLTIVELKIPSVLAYTWGEDVVHFELNQEPDGCRLVLTEKIKTITPHTPRDLAGWHVCLEVISALLDGRTIIHGRRVESLVRKICPGDRKGYERIMVSYQMEGRH